MQTARFEQLRKKALDKIFEVKQIAKIWRTIVKQQLRSQDIQDFFDYFDFNFNVFDRARAIRASVLSGDYKASQPLVYRLEKKFGISRHMVLPQATDALVMQVLIETIAETILKHQPSKKAFYSRSKHNVPKPHEATEYGLSLAGLWIKLQKTIYKFSREKALIVSTDLSNYYDSIDMRELNKVLVNYLDANTEVVTDLLFGIIKDVSWRPDYLPYSGRSLPTSNLEAMRLLAHAFLFEIDDVLQDKTEDCFTRWMDDIVIGVDTKKEAREVVSSISDMLKSRGLALNLAKTHIYDRDEAFFNFQIEENEYISSIENTLPKRGDHNYNEFTTHLKRRFQTHIKENRSAKSWDKVAKRYITQFGKMKSEKLLTEIGDLYVNHPVLRTNLLIYLHNLGYRRRTSEKVLEIFDKIDVFDDISLYQLCDLVVRWEIPDNTLSDNFLREFESRLMAFAFSRTNPLDFYTLIWFKGKYSRADDLLIFLEKYRNLWQSDSFLRRQATALLSRTYIADRTKVKKILQSQISSGESNTVSLANQLQLFLKLDVLNNILSYYLFPPNVIQKPYPLSKFLVLCSVLNSEDIRNDSNVRKKISEYISDPYYRKWLDQNYGISWR